MDKPVVHILVYRMEGKLLCGKNSRDLGHGEKWVGLGDFDEDEATCPICIEQRRRRKDVRRNY